MGCGGSKRQRPESLIGGNGRANSNTNIITLPVEEKFKKAKVIVMGSLSVGKTSIIKAFVEDKSQHGSI